MAQFTSYPAARPQPFAIYNNQRSTLMSELGEALTALGNIPQQIEQNKIKSELNKLLLTSLTAPRTETKQVQGPPEFTGTIEGEWPSDTSMLTPPGQQNVQDFFKPGSMLTKQVPGEKYAEATGRLEDVGYKAGGFDFGPTSGSQLSLGDRIQLKKLDIEGRKDVKETEYDRKERLQAQKIKAQLEATKKEFEEKEKFDQQHMKRLAAIKADDRLNDQQRWQAELEERDRHHRNMLDVARYRAQSERKGIDTVEDWRQTQEVDKLLTNLQKELTQINKIRGLPDQATVQRRTEMAQGIMQYNDAVRRMKQINPDSAVMEMTPENAPFSDTAVWDIMRGLLYGNPAQTYRTNPTPMQPGGPRQTEALPPIRERQPSPYQQQPGGQQPLQQPNMLPPPSMMQPPTPSRQQQPSRQQPQQPTNQPLTPQQLREKREKVYQELDKLYRPQQ